MTREELREKARAYVEEIAGAMSDHVETWGLTRPEVRRQSRSFGSDEVVVLGVPVYYGRVPEVEGLLDGLTESDTPAVLAGEFIALHTFSAKVGAGRPDEADRETARALGKQAADKLDKTDWTQPQLPGKRPYREFQVAPFYPEGDSRCVQCGACVRTCPVEAISSQDPRQTDSERCLRCLACVRACPTGSRAVRSMAYDATVDKLEHALVQPRQPQLYL